MGTIHYADGEITFTPALTAVALRSDTFAPYLVDEQDGERSVRLIVDLDKILQAQVLGQRGAPGQRPSSR